MPNTKYRANRWVPRFASSLFPLQCWCGDSYDVHGKSKACDYQCEGDSTQKCGGYNALSVYST